VKVITIETPELGDRSYLIGPGAGGHEAVVIDPQRDLDRLEAALAAAGWTCALVLETHLHNDYVSGGLELARRTGASYGVHCAECVTFTRRGVREGELLRVGSLEIAVLETPGHTENHVAYVIQQQGEPAAVFSGGSLLFGSVGRTDLVHPERTVFLARAQYHSARKLGALPEDAVLYPTHGFGSMCSAGPTSGARHGTIGQERVGNAALTDPDVQHFVVELLAGLTPYPAYYAHMSGLNARGPVAADLSAPQRVDADELGKRIAAGSWVVDLRDRSSFAAQHLAGSIGFALSPQFATYLGWLIPWGSPLTLIGGYPQDVADAQRQLVRIGIDHLAGSATGSVAELAGGHAVRSYPRRTFADLAAEPDRTVLDVRRDDERTRGGIAGSAHIPLHSLQERMTDVPAGPVWVHCAAGFRASIAASLLDRAGHNVVLVDDDWSRAAEAGLQIV
jgi:glyoxylase-like metal-dependent hydrolase (beta-lactamase superfamily II)/rhodanese-related sulfurtransferase